MKKQIFILAMAAIGFVACSNDETVAVNTSPQDNEISFRALTTGMTRAADASFAAGKSFKVTAFQTTLLAPAYIDDVTFTGAGTPVVFSSATKYYWPKTYNLDFYAYAPLTAEVVDVGGASVTRSTYNSFIVTPGTSVPDQPDFVYAVTKGWGTYTGYTHNGAGGVTINFRHAESKVIIQLKNTNGSLKFTVGNVSIGNLRGTETFTWNQSTTGGNTPTTAAHTDDQSGYYLDGTWTATSAQTSAYTVAVEIDDVDDETEGTQPRNEFDGSVATARDLTSTAPNHEMILIPQVLNPQTTYESDAANANFVGAYITVKLKIQNKSNSEYLAGAATGPAAGDYDENGFVTAMWPLTELTWLPGHKYTYTVDLAGGGYFTNNKSGTTNALDPILEGAEIKFVTVTVDGWTDAPGINVQ